MTRPFVYGAYFSKEERYFIMLTKTVEIINKNGLHARPASDFVKEAGKYKCSVTVARAGEDASPSDAKSIISVLLLGLCKGEQAVITTDGEDEEEALNNIVALIESGFGE